MKARPFRFLDSEDASRSLDARLRQVGYERLDDEVPQAATTVYACPWRMQRLVLRWRRAWWPDGENAYDAGVEVFDGEVRVGTIDLDDLLRSRLERPLRDVVIDRLVGIASSVSGKRVS